MIKPIVILSALASLAIAGAALAAGPTLSVTATTSDFGVASSTVIRFENTGGDPTASLDLFAPPGYRISLDQPIGSTFGNVTGRASTPTATEIRVSGLVKNADPVTFAATAASCTPDRATHDAVWTANLNAGGAPLGRLVLFVDLPGPARSDDYSLRMRACLDDPVVAGFRLLRAALTLNGIFANPSERGEYRWTAILRTFSQLPSPPLANQTIVGLPPKLTLTRKVIRPNGRRGRAFIRLSGALTANGRGVSGVRVQVFAGPQAEALTRLTYATSFERGKYELVAPLRGNRVFRARVVALLRAGPLSRCDSFKLQPDAVCSSLMLAPFTAQSPTVQLGGG